jgi:transposase-like protein
MPALIVAVGVNGDGRREVVGMDIGPPEAEPCWTGTSCNHLLDHLCTGLT